jgi:hypothetical protein
VSSAPGSARKSGVESGEFASLSASRRSRGGLSRPDVAAWLLLAAFVSLLLSVVLPAAVRGGGTALGAALLFMVGLVAAFAGSGIALATSSRRFLTALGLLLVLAGLVLLYGLVPSLAALSVVLAGVALQIASLPAGN